jgi:hypothetical protein
MSATPPVSAAGLLERTGSLAALSELLSGVRSTREGRLALLAGEAGVRTRGEAGAEAIRLGLADHK